MRFLLRPGWIALVVGVLAFVVACYTLLAPWQFGREGERDATQRAIDAANATPAVPFAQLVPGGTIEPGDVWRRVSLTGEFLPGSDTLVRLRTLDGGPAFDVLTALRLLDGRVVTVDRGSVPAGPNASVPAFPPPPAGTVTVEGRLRVNETDPNARPPLTEGGARQIYAMDSRGFTAATGIATVQGVVTLAGGAPGVLAPIPVEVPSGGAPFTNFSYALQWLTFGAVALVALGIFIRLEVLQRRGRRAPRGVLRDALAGRDEDGVPPRRNPVSGAPGRDERG